MRVRQRAGESNSPTCGHYTSARASGTLIKNQLRRLAERIDRAANFAAGRKAFTGRAHRPAKVFSRQA